MSKEEAKKELSPKEQYNEDKKLLELGIRKAIQDVAITASGKLFLHWFMKQCGFHSSSIAIDTDGSIDKDGLLINEALRRMYLNIRPHIPPHVLPEVEYLDIHKVIVEELKVTKGEKK